MPGRVNYHDTRSRHESAQLFSRRSRQFQIGDDSKTLTLREYFQVDYSKFYLSVKIALGDTLTHSVRLALVYIFLSKVSCRLSLFLESEEL